MLSPWGQWGCQMWRGPEGEGNPRWGDREMEIGGAGPEVQMLPGPGEDWRCEEIPDGTERGLCGEGADADVSGV